MATKAEKQALGFLVAVAIAGGVVRAVGVDRFAASPARGVVADRDLGARALADQLEAVDSARRAGPRRGRARPNAVPRGRPPQNVTDRTGRTSASPDARSSSRTDRPKPHREDAALTSPIDVNAANASELERLPKVGPALARRIVEWRERHGPFRGPDDLRHVRGIGVATLRLIAPHVTFSGRHSPLLSEGPPGPAHSHDGDD